MNIGTVQKIRKLVLFLAILASLAFAAVTASRTPSGEKIHELIEWIGIILIVTCILGRTWSSLYIAGRKNTELVNVGPYSVSRNPLYFFSILGGIGMGAQMGSIAIAAIWGFVAWFVFFLVVQREERLLLKTYGKRYRDYIATIPRFLPRPSLWKDNPTLTIRPPRVLMTFADALLFLLAIPLAELFETLQDIGLLPVLFVLP